MKALDLLLSRSSFSRVSDPAPHGKELENIIAAGLRAPDHAHLGPFEFIVCEGEGLARLTDIFTAAAVEDNLPEEKQLKAAKMAYRAPMIIVAIMRYTYHEKVPREEQIATTACAVQNMQMAAQAQGFNGIWRTGSYAKSDTVRQAFGLSELDELVGFLYLGTPDVEVPIKRQRESNHFIKYWR